MHTIERVAEREIRVDEQLDVVASFEFLDESLGETLEFFALMEGSNGAYPHLLADPTHGAGQQGLDGKRDRQYANGNADARLNCQRLLRHGRNVGSVEPIVERIHPLGRQFVGVEAKVRNMYSVCG